jgi:hypothetical protein
VSNYPYPKGIGAAAPAPPPPPATYNKFWYADTNGSFDLCVDHLVRSANAAEGGVVATVQAIAVIGNSSGKWLAQLTNFDTVSSPYVWFGLAPGLPAAIAVPNTNFGTAGNGVMVRADGYVLNPDFGESGPAPAMNFETYSQSVIMAADLDNHRLYLGLGTSWIIGNPFTGTGGLSLHPATTYYCAAALGDPTPDQAFGGQWGSGPLPGWSGLWVPPGYNGWHF